MDWSFLQGDALHLPLSDLAVSLTIGSPPYLDCRKYYENGKDLGISRKMDAWITWMLDVTAEALRVTNGPVIWVASGKTEGRNYQPACEGLMYRWWQRGGECHMYRPVYWHRHGIFGSGGDQWFRADIEYCMCFKRPGKLPFADNKAMGHPPKWAPGGEASYRLPSGARRTQWGGVGTSCRKKDGTRDTAIRPSMRILNQWGHSWATGGTAGSKDGVTCAAPRPSHRMVEARSPHTTTLPDGEMVTQAYCPPAIANPGNLVRVVVGGGLMGHPLAHENEAPYPIDLPTFFIKSLTRPGDIVFDPFSGSGTTVDAAVRCGRRGLGMDLRMSQCRLSNRRLSSPIIPKRKKHKPAPSEPTLFPDTQAA